MENISPFMEKNHEWFIHDCTIYIYLFILLDIPLFCLTVVLDSSSKKELPYGRSKRDEATASRLYGIPWFLTWSRGSVPSLWKDQRKHDLSYRFWTSLFEEAYRILGNNIGKEYWKQLEKLHFKMMIREHTSGASLLSNGNFGGPKGSTHGQPRFPWQTSTICRSFSMFTS